MPDTLKIKVASAGRLKCKLKVPGASKSKLESTWYVSSKYLTCILEIKIASAGHLKYDFQVRGTWIIKLESTWYVSSIDMKFHMSNRYYDYHYYHHYYCHFNYNYHYHYYLCMSNLSSKTGTTIKFI